MESVRCELQYSRAALAFVGVAAAATAALAATLALPAGARLALVAAVLAEALRAGLALAAPRGVRVDVDGGFAVAGRDGRWREGRVRAGGFVAPWLTIVRWRPDGARRDRTVLLVAGMADADALRKIRVILRWGREYLDAGRAARPDAGRQR